MKGAVASVEIFALSGERNEAFSRARRLTLTITAPERGTGESGGWTCRVALADLHRPETIRAADSVSALSGALAQARSWLGALRAQGMLLARDRAGESIFSLD
jgi:hypothetical protein